ncbi:MAG: SDR family oxidoreductase, partial [Frankia sp.]|nr:SDR family oxidoreductase [Frankia sp.]
MAKSVVVTGANSGIGLATVLELATHGYDVIGTARTAEKAAHIEEQARERGTVVRTVRCDVADAEQTEKAWLEIAAMTDGGPWALVNNAGFAQSGAVEDVDDEAARYQLEVNVVAPARLARLALPSMRERGSGRIVNVSSIAGRVSLPMLGWYCASKHALEALSDALRAEVAGFGVRVILVEPGSFGSNIWDTGHSRAKTQTSAYGTAYRRADGVAAKAGRLPDPVWVARVIRVALANPVPLPRYLVGVDAMVGTALETLTPTGFADFVK